MPYRVAQKRPRRRTFIRQWREFRGLSQDQLAERLEMSKAQVSRIETGISPYTQDFLEACADALLTDAASLLMRNPSDPDAIWSIWDKAKPGERQRIVEAATKALRKAN